MLEWPIARRQRIVKWKSILNRKVEEARRQKEPSDIIFHGDDLYDIWGEAYGPQEDEELW